MKRYNVEIEVLGKKYQTTVKAFNEEGAKLVAIEAFKKNIKVLYVCESIEDKIRGFFETFGK